LLKPLVSIGKQHLRTCRHPIWGEKASHSPP
jgi:hypothetical protein